MMRDSCASFRLAESLNSTSPIILSHNSPRPSLSHEAGAPVRSLEQAPQRATDRSKWLPAAALSVLLLLILLGALLGESERLTQLIGGSNSANTNHHVGTETLLSVQCDDANRCQLLADNSTLVGQLWMDAPRTMAPFELQLTLPTLQLSEPPAIEFAMLGMDMGRHRYRLEAQQPGQWQARIVLPICSSGRRDWIARLLLSPSTGQLLRAEIPFVADGGAATSAPPGGVTPIRSDSNGNDSRN